MPRAVVLNTASKANTTGGTFADTLTANSGDSLTIPNLQSGKGRILRMWGIDSDSVAEVAMTAGRVESVHDPQFGIRSTETVNEARKAPQRGGGTYPLQALVSRKRRALRFRRDGSQKRATGRHQLARCSRPSDKQLVSRDPEHTG